MLFVSAVEGNKVPQPNTLLSLYFVFANINADKNRY